ncbi:MAG: TonB family protein [Hyphomonadaceae bacterium]
MAVIFAATCLAASGAAQDVTVDAPLQFRSRPTPEDIQSAYPHAALEERQEGRVLLCCLVRSTGTLACAAVSEAPEGLGFGDAAREVSSLIRLTPASAAQWRDRNGGPMRVPIEFTLPRANAPAPAYAEEPLCGTRTGVGSDLDPPAAGESAERGADPPAVEQQSSELLQ